MVGSADISNWDWFNLDDLLSHETPKVVVIRDRRLGCLYYVVCMIIASYVFGFQILYANEHYPQTAVTGTSRLVIMQPTVGNCDPDSQGCVSDFTSLEELAYCKEYAGETTFPPNYQKPCVFADRNSISPSGQLEEHLLIPTMVESEVQQKGCEPSAENGHSCSNEYVGTGVKDSVFVADIERYMIHVHHTYSRLSESGANTDVQGYYLYCDPSQSPGWSIASSVYGTGDLQCEGRVIRKSIECLAKDCPFLNTEDHALHASSETASFLQSIPRRIRHFGASLLLRAAQMLSDDTISDSKANQTLNASTVVPTHPLSLLQEQSSPHKRHGHNHGHHRNHHGRMMRSDEPEAARRNIETDAKGHNRFHGHKATLESLGSIDSTEFGVEEVEEVGKENLRRFGSTGERLDETPSREKDPSEDVSSDWVKKKDWKAQLHTHGTGMSAGVSPKPILDMGKRPNMTTNQLSTSNNWGQNSISVTKEPGTGSYGSITPGTPEYETMQGGIWSLPDSDVFTIKKILELSGVDLDHGHNPDGKTLREAGTVITVEAIYWNLHPFTSVFGNNAVEYEYRVSKRSLDKFSNMAYSQYQPHFPAERILELRNGLYVIVKIGGKFGSFSLTYLLILIATSVGLMKVATLMVDKVSMYFMQMKETYQLAKYQYTERVWDLQKQLDSLLNFGDALDNLDLDENVGEAPAESGAGVGADGGAGPKAKAKAKAASSTSNF